MNGHPKDKLIAEAEGILGSKVNISVNVVPEDECAMHLALLNSVIKYKLVNGTAYHFETPEEVCIILEHYRICGTRVKLHYGDINTGLDWEDSESGTVYRSNKDIRLPKLYTSINSHGGSPILDHKIVKITAYGGAVLYEHFAYHQKPHLKQCKRRKLNKLTTHGN